MISFALDSFHSDLIGPVVLHEFRYISLVLNVHASFHICFFFNFELERIIQAHEAKTSIQKHVCN